jgi:formylglycine-generating enzyme required for sulfatase activity
MDVKYSWNGIAGTSKHVTSNPASFDGQSITSTQYKGQSWWTTADNWSGGAWDFATIWQKDADNPPKLRSVGGNQDHILQMPPFAEWISGGSFLMGSPASEVYEPRETESERPQHTVILTGFYMAKYQITQKQYRTVMGTNPSYFNGGSGRAPASGEIQDNRPVEQVSWYDAVEFCNKLSATEKLEPVYTISNRVPAAGYPITSATVTANWNKNGYRLPTEAQWEYACRAGTTTAFNDGQSFLSGSPSNAAWHILNSGNITHEVGRKQHNNWGLYDMHGNVKEWCWDYYDEHAYTDNLSQNPPGPSSGYGRVIRGGFYYDVPKEQRSAARSYAEPGYCDSGIGFRVVRP